MFVRTMGGDYYPAAAVERLWEEADETGRKIEQAAFKDVGVHRLAEGEICRLLEAGAHPFPAAPDTYVLQEVVDEDNRMVLERVPVLGWLVSAQRGVLPITIEGVNHGLRETAAVLMPSGEVVVALNCTYANEQCYVAEVRSAPRRR